MDVLPQVLDLTNARLTGSIPTAWFDSSARAAAAGALLPTIQATQRTQATQTAGSSQIPAATQAQAGTLSDAAAVSQQAATAAGTETSMAVGLTQLAELRLAGNSLSGNISDGIELLSNLRVLDLSGNTIGGQLPLKLATLSKLQVSNTQWWTRVAAKVHNFRATCSNASRTACI
jgi:hypothetical protein